MGVLLTLFFLIGDIISGKCTDFVLW